jgi:quinol monooxygenase YgiN
MINVTLRIDVRKDQKVEINRLFRSLIGPTRVETGCISCRLYHETDNPNVLTWIEEWRTDDDLKRHLRSEQYKKILAALDMSNVQPEIRFDTVVETAGMQLIAEARGVKELDYSNGSI